MGEELESVSEDLNKQLEGLGQNLGEAVEELGSSIAAANERTAAEAEQGAEKWNQLTQEVTAALEPSRAADPAGEGSKPVAEMVQDSGTHLQS